MPGKKGNRDQGAVSRRPCHAISERSSMTDISPLNPVSGAHCPPGVRDGLNAPPKFDARTIRDMTRGLLQRLTEFERAVRRLDGGQDGATDYANARLVLVGGVEESIETIDDAREVSVPCSNLVAAVERCRAALDNVRNQPDAVPPLPVDESVIGADDDTLYRNASHVDDVNHTDPAPSGSFH